MSREHLKNGLNNTEYEHDSLEMNGNNTNIHGNMLEWLENSLNILQCPTISLNFKSDMHKRNHFPIQK